MTGSVDRDFLYGHGSQLTTTQFTRRSHSSIIHPESICYSDLSGLLWIEITGFVHQGSSRRSRGPAGGYRRVQLQIWLPVTCLLWLVLLGEWNTWQVTLQVTHNPSRYLWITPNSALDFLQICTGSASWITHYLPLWNALPGAVSKALSTRNKVLYGFLFCFGFGRQLAYFTDQIEMWHMIGA